MMGALAQRLHGYALMSALALLRAARLREPALRIEWHRQLHHHCIAALPVALGLCALAGAVAVTQLIGLAGLSSDAAQSWLFQGLFFELVPLLTALVVAARSSAALASELALMGQHDEFRALRRLGVPPVDFLLLPRMLALALGLPVITLLGQVVAVISGWLAVSLLQSLPLQEVAGHFLQQADVDLTLLSLLKSAVMGLLIGATACHHGTEVRQGRSRDLSDAAIQAVGSALVAVFVVDGTVAFLVYGGRT